ncbi:MAG: SufD family Fe-S cluster assembly protein [Nitrososphaerota archaeon]|nr:SufD family Fe-S cluster assembly protein [Nitrososphaerota archaeon]MDG7020998.1 SufD family Fe-S cluster assembly protein [Nitrososphaerota archaeon]
MAQSAVSRFTEEQVSSISRRAGEPSWLMEYRFEALKSFSSLPLETSPLYKKYGGVSAFDPEQFSVADDEEAVDMRGHFEGFLTGRETNIVLQGNSTTVHIDLDERYAETGIEVLPIRDAISKHGSLIKDLLSRRLADPKTEKYAAFNAAFFTSGIFIRVPRGARAPSSLRRLLVTRNPSSSIVETTIIYAEESSKFEYLQEVYTAESQGPFLLSSSFDVFAESGSQVDGTSVQLLDDDGVYVSNEGASVAANARASLATVFLGGGVTRSRFNLGLNGRGASFEGYDVFFCDGRQRFDLDANLVHNSPDSQGALTARGVLKGESQSIFKGMAKIRRGAKNSHSYIAHHAMLLDKRARSDAIPGLDIDTNEVKATHSASVAQIDEDQVFYLEARGLPEDEAKKLIVTGFFEPVISRIPLEFAREGARFTVEGKWSGERRRLVDKETLLALTGEVPDQERHKSDDIFERHYKYRG